MSIKNKAHKEDLKKKLSDLFQEEEEDDLIYISDTIPGIRRVSKYRKFVYLDPKGRTVTDTETLIRIKSLVLPPAWEEVWISPFENSHLQATGIDAKGRKQYKYHVNWRKLRDLDKFDRLNSFAKKLPLIRKYVNEDLKLRGLPKQRVLAIIVRLLDKTFLRIGNLEYERENKTYGLTTLKNRHVIISGNQINFKFKAKSGKESVLSIRDRCLAKLLQKCKELPGPHLFNYVDEEGFVREIDSRDVNQYLKDLSGEDFTAKDFRTWGGTVHAFRSLKELVPFGGYTSETQKKKTIVACIRYVAETLKNTVNVCKKYYIHPKVFDAFEKGKVPIVRNTTGRIKKEMTGLNPEELVVSRILNA